MGEGAIEFYTTVSTTDYAQKGTEFEQRVKDALLGNEEYKYELIEKGYISPDGKVVINPVGFNAKLARAIKFARQSVGDQAKIAANKFMHLLGASQRDQVGIPRQAYDHPLQNTPIPGQNRIAYMRMANVDYNHGLMLGGIGTGGIERTPQGIFRRVGFTFVGQNVEDKEGNMASQFHVYLKTPSKTFASTLCTEKPAGEKLSAWKWNYDPNNGSYHALYPVEWHVYQGADMPAKVTITSFSPIIQGNYKESSYPVVVYKVTIKNTSGEVMDAAFMFTMQNLVGWKPNTADNTWAPKAVREIERKQSRGIQPIFGSPRAKDFVSEWQPESEGNSNLIVKDGSGNVHLLLTGEKNDLPDTSGQIAVSMPKRNNLQVTYVTAFDADGDGAEVKGFYDSGILPDQRVEKIAGKHLAGALAFKVKGLLPGEEIEVPVVLTYNFPYSKQGDTILRKRYTRFFGSNERAVLVMGATALSSYQDWEARVQASQKAMGLNHPELPDWYEGAVLNKLNLLQTDSIGWFSYDGGELAGYQHAAQPYGLFLMGESNKVDYNHVETWDVRSYSFARALFWPGLEQAISSYFAETIPQQDLSNTYFREQNAASVEKLRLQGKTELLPAVYGPRKVKGATPHDIWSSATGPRMNTYTHQNANLWPGLPPRGMLQALRNYRLTGDKDAFARQYEGFSAALDYAKAQLDKNNDGIPDFLIPKNDVNVAIWTYDNWKWSKDDGINAYTAGLWLVSLAAAAAGAKALGKAEDAARYSRLLEQGRKVFDKKLWRSTGRNSGYYQLGGKVKDVFSDYLCFFYDKALGLGVFPEDKVKMTLRTVYKYNVQGFGNGYLGAVNGTRDGRIIPGEQERESWSGTSFALGATMLAYGMTQEGWNVIYGTENLTTNQAGHFGDWAEAYTIEPGKNGIPAYGSRAKNYLRQLSITDALFLFRKK